MTKEASSKIAKKARSRFRLIKQDREVVNMQASDWEFIVSNWGSEDESVQQKIGEMKQRDSQEFNNLNAKIAESDKAIEKLQFQNTELNKTNMNLVLRLTDPALMQQPDPEPDIKKGKSLTDYDSFVVRKG